MKKNLFLLTCLLLFLLHFGCKKEEPSPSLPLNKLISSEFSSNGLSALYEYEYEEFGYGCWLHYATWSKIINRISTSDGWEITFSFEPLVDGVTVHYENGGNAFNQFYGDADCDGFLEYCDQDNSPVRSEFEYGNGGHLTKKVTNESGNETTDIFIWEDGNLIASTTHELGQEVSREYEYYLNKVNTIGNENFGQHRWGFSSKNPVKRMTSHFDAGDVVTDYTYEFDSEGYITKVTESSLVSGSSTPEVSWRKFTYE